jgi:hypothetical protein
MFFERVKSTGFAANTKTRVKREFLSFILVRALGLGESSLDSHHRVSWSHDEIREKIELGLKTDSCNSFCRKVTLLISETERAALPSGVGHYWTELDKQILVFFLPLSPSYCCLFWSSLLLCSLLVCFGCH